jgi:hypothetical protein
MLNQAKYSYQVWRLAFVRGEMIPEWAPRYCLALECRLRQPSYLRKIDTEGIHVQAV